MLFRQYELGCLSQLSYLIGDETTGRAVIVDPRRDVNEYLNDAAELGLLIERVIETHVHADFLSGHLELAGATGAVISYGLGADTEFPIEPLADGQHLGLGDVDLEIRATPGHTPESICIVVRERIDAVPHGVLTGDTLFIGDVGRPDLVGAPGHSPGSMARDLYRSLRDKLLTLPDATRVYPAHGAGSACGKHLSTETSSTIGEQRRTNYALMAMDEDRFVDLVLEGQTPPPPYFAHSARRNRELRAAMDEDAAVATLDYDATLAAQREGAVVLDVRDPAVFAAGHLPGALNVGSAGRFAEWAGAVVDPDSPIVLVSEPGVEREARNRLGRIGYDTVIGVLEGGTAAVPRPALAPASRLSVDQLVERLSSGAPPVLVDVRGRGEVEGGTIPGAVLLPLPELRGRIDELDPDAPTVVFCASGFRSSIAASALRAAGFSDVSDVLGGYGAWSDRRSG